MSRIARFESLAEQLVEGTFARLFAGHISPLEVAQRLTRAMEDYQVSVDGIPQAPTHYWVYLHPDDWEALSEQVALEKQLAQHVSDLAAQAGLALKVPPTVYVLPNQTVGIHQVRIEARWMPEETTETEKTREIETIQAQAAESGTEEFAAPAGRPFLILEGRRHVDLLKPVISIGRALDNDVIIEDPRVSRHHVQLRQRYGRYVLYDIGSSGGTKINGYAVHECVLHAGDVISLAGVEIVYGEDAPVASPARDRPTPTSQETQPDQ